MSDFVKSATTSVPVAKSQTAIIAMLGRYGATGFGFRRVGPIVSVTFYLPTNGREQAVEIPVNVATVESRLGDSARRAVTKQGVANRPQGDETHADRVAWRVLYLWIDAALAAVSLGAQSLEEAFFAHLVVVAADGSTGRLVDYVASLGLGSGAPLPSARALRLGGAS